MTDVANFYSHAPCGARPGKGTERKTSQTFLLTRPMRGATCRHIRSSLPDRRFLLTRPMRGATDRYQKRYGRTVDFYSHAPCGARRARRSISGCRDQFLLTRPMRGATRIWMHQDLLRNISTHTPHAGRDISPIALFSIIKNISTHTPHAGRDFVPNRIVWDHWNFYSHAPCGARQ